MQMNSARHYSRPATSVLQQHEWTRGLLAAEHSNSYDQLHRNRASRLWAEEKLFASRQHI